MSRHLSFQLPKAADLPSTFGFLEHKMLHKDRNTGKGRRTPVVKGRRTKQLTKDQAVELHQYRHQLATRVKWALEMLLW